MTIAMPRRMTGRSAMLDRPSDVARPGSRSSSETAAPAAALDVRAAFAQHGSALLGFAVNALHDRTLAEDCVQETFLRAWRARASFDAERGSVRTWLFAIERRVVLDVYRARERTPRLVPHDEAPEQASDDRDPLERLGMVEALARLSEPQRAAIVAIHLQGMSYAEHAAATGVAVPTLRTRVFYALRSLRAILHEQDTTDA